MSFSLDLGLLFFQPFSYSSFRLSVSHFGISAFEEFQPLSLSNYLSFQLFSLSDYLILSASYCLVIFLGFLGGVTPPTIFSKVGSRFQARAKEEEPFFYSAFHSVIHFKIIYFSCLSLFVGLLFFLIYQSLSLSVT